MTGIPLTHGRGSKVYQVPQKQPIAKGKHVRGFFSNMNLFRLRPMTAAEAESFFFGLQGWEPKDPQKDHVLAI